MKIPKERKPTKRAARVHAVAEGVEVPIVSLTAIKRAGMEACAAGADEAALEAAIGRAVDSARGATT